MEVLLVNGALDSSIRCCNQLSALRFATSVGYNHMVQFLVNHKITVNSQEENARMAKMGP